MMKIDFTDEEIAFIEGDMMHGITKLDENISDNNYPEYMVVMLKKIISIREVIIDKLNGAER